MKKIIFVFLAMISGMGALQAQLTAHFTSSQTEGCSNTYFSFQADDLTNVEDYDWQVDGQPFGANIATAGTYLSADSEIETYEICLTITISDSGGEQGTYCETITVYPGDGPELTVYPEDTTACYGDTILLQAITSDVLTYQWSDLSGNGYIECDTCQSTLAIVGDPIAQYYWLDIVDANGCMNYDTIVINVGSSCSFEGAVWPGDTDTNKVVNNFDLINLGLSFNEEGPLRSNASTSWFGQAAVDWSSFAPDGTNNKHVDTDGNGTINISDIFAIILNWGETHNFTGDPVEQFNNDYPSASSTGLEAPFYVQPDTFEQGETIALPIILGDMELPAEDIYGIAFSIEYDSSMIVPESAYLTFDESWMGVNNANMMNVQKTFHNPGRIDIGLTRIDHTNTSGFGMLGKLFITIEDDILFRSENDGDRGALDDVDVIFNITNVLIVNKDGEMLEVNPMSTTSLIFGTTSATDNINNTNKVKIYPNPANDQLFITSKDLNIQTVKVFSLTGQMLYSKHVDVDRYALPTASFKEGIYIIQIQTNEGLINKRVTILH